MTQERIPRSGGSAPAFPNDQGLMIADRVGMSKREHFAALFMAQMFGNPSISHDTPSGDMARIAVRSADVLVEILSKADREDA